MTSVMGGIGARPSYNAGQVKNKGFGIGDGYYDEMGIGRDDEIAAYLYRLGLSQRELGEARERVLGWPKGSPKPKTNTPEGLVLLSCGFDYAAPNSVELLDFSARLVRRTVDSGMLPR